MVHYWVYHIMTNFDSSTTVKKNGWTWKIRIACENMSSYYIVIRLRWICACADGQSSLVTRDAATLGTPRMNTLIRTNSRTYKHWSPSVETNCLSLQGCQKWKPRLPFRGFLLQVRAADVLSILAARIFPSRWSSHPNFPPCPDIKHTSREAWVDLAILWIPIWFCPKMLRIHWFIFPNRYFLSGHGAKSSSPSDTNYPLVWKLAQQWNISISNRQPTNGGLSIYFKFDSSEIVQDACIHDAFDETFWIHGLP